MKPSNQVRRGIALASLVALIAIAGTGCTRSGAANELSPSGETLRGTVTHRGNPIPYGFVLLFGEGCLDAATGLVAPTAVGVIRNDGTYQIDNVSVGPVVVAVASDPTADPIWLMRPMLPGESELGFIPLPNGPPLPEATLHEGELPPGTWDLSEEKKRELKAIHAKYGSYGKGGLSIDVPPGGLVYDIPLE